MPNLSRRLRLPAVVLAAVLAVALLGGCAGSGQPRNAGGFVGAEPSLTRIAPDQRVMAPVVSGVGLDGATRLSTADHRGRVLVLNVWGSWCAPCQAEATDLQAASEQTRGVATFLGLNTRDYDRANAVAFNRRYQVTYPSIYDPGGSALIGLAAQVPPKAIPTTLVLDAEGRVAARITSTVTTLTLVGLVEEVADGR